MRRLLRSISLSLCILIAMSAGAVSAAPTVAPAPSGIRLAVIMFTLPATTTFSVTPDELRATYFGSGRSVATLYREASGNALSISGDVLGPYAVSGDNGSCAINGWRAAADAAATNAGVDLAGYTHFAYLFPRVEACPWAGLGDVGGNATYINAPAKGDVGLFHAAHELGHNLGAGHAHGLRCVLDGATVMLSASAGCSKERNADPLTLMGSGVVREPSGWDRLRMGLLAPDEVSTVDANSAAYDLVPLDGDAGGTRLLVVPSPAGGYLAVEYRRSSGTFDALVGLNLPGAVFVRSVGETGEDSALVDRTPTTSSFRDAAFLLGDELRHADGDVVLRVVGMDGDSARIQVAPPDAAPAPILATAPRPPVGLSATVGSDQRATLDWSAPADQSVEGYRVLRDGKIVSATRETGFIDDAPLTSQTTYAVVSVGDAGTTSEPIRIVVAPRDVAAPSRVRSITVRRRDSRTVIVSWTAASDPSGISRYMVRVDNGSWRSTSARSLKFKDFVTGTHRVTVYAIDGAGNRGRARSRMTSL